MLAIKRALCLVIVVCLSTPSWSATSSCKFRRGDSDGNYTVNIADAQHLYAYVYNSGPAPPNKDAADANDDGYINETDSNYLTLYLYMGGNPPPDPGPTSPDCDPTTSDILEKYCTPIGAITVTSATAVPSIIAGAAWDCNSSFVQLDRRKIDISSDASESTEDNPCSGFYPTDQLTGTPCCNRGHDPCAHPDMRTRWTFTWNIGSSPSVERLAFNSACTELYLQIDWAGNFYVPVGSCACDPYGTGQNLLSWRPEDAQLKFTFKNQTTQQNVEEVLFWYHDFMATSALSVTSGEQCSVLAKIPGPDPNPNAEDKALQMVSWAGNDQWKLTKVEVKFVATFFRDSTQDNAAEESVGKGTHEWSVYLRTLAYDDATQ